MDQEIRRKGGLNIGKRCSAGSLSPKMSIRLVLRSSDSQQVYNGNTPHDFMVHLPKPLYLQGHWTISLLEFNLSVATPQPELYVCSNLCQDSIVGDRELPLLRLVNLKMAENIIYNYPYQVPLRLGEFQDVRVYIRDASNQPASFLKGVTTLTLLLKKRLFEIQ